jgi:integrase
MSTNRQKYGVELDRLRKDKENGRISEPDEKAIRELCYAYDENQLQVSPPKDADKKKRELTTLLGWCVELRKVAREVELTSATANDINAHFTEWLNGDKLKRNSIRNYQGSVRRFYRYHDDLDPEPDEIALISGAETSIDPSNMLNEEEIHKLREAAESPRDLAVFDLLLYTGQRSMAIRSLRVQDVKPEEGVFYLNPEVDGLKGARRQGRKRPLLLAAASVRDWLRYHPCPDDPDAYLITSKGKFNKPNPRKMVSQETIARVCRNLKEKTDIEKPLHPHVLRHNFVTLAKRVYEMDDSAIKFLIGHNPDSRVMETTYAHLSEQDHIDHAEHKMGIREKDESKESPLTPPSCPRCGEPLPNAAKACAKCGMIFTPDAHATRDLIDELALEGMREAEVEEERDAVEEFQEFLKQNPEKAVEILRNEL